MRLKLSKKKQISRVASTPEYNEALNTLLIHCNLCLNVMYKTIFLFLTHEKNDYCKYFNCFWKWIFRLFIACFTGAF